MKRTEEQSIVVLTSDHGEEFLDHGGLEHGHTLYDEMLHVPLIVRVPGFRHLLPTSTQGPYRQMRALFFAGSLLLAHILHVPFDILSCYCFVLVKYSD